MNIKKELFIRGIAEHLAKNLDLFEINENEIADTVAIKVLSEIRSVIATKTLSDFEAVEEIICIFEKYDIDCGARHDF